MTAATRPPAWVRVADAAAVAACVLTVFVVLFGGFDLRLPGFAVRVHSAGRLLFFAAALIAVRHASHPSPPLHRRLLVAIRERNTRSDAGVVTHALASRAVVLFIGYFAVLTVGIDRPTQGFVLSPDHLFNLPARFDAGWYGGIALDGYHFGGSFDRQQNIAFFPAWPMLMRAAGYPIGAFAPGVAKERRMARLLWGGTILSILAFAWGVLYLWRLARDTIGEPSAPAAVALFAAYPFAMYYSAPYTESLFFLGSVAAIYHFRRHELIAAAIWGAVVGLTRPNGCFLSVVLALMMVESMWKISKFPPSQISKSLAAASAPGLAMLAYSAYVNSLTGAWFGWARLHEAWGRSYSGVAPMTRAYGWITDEGLLHVFEGVPFDTLNSFGLIFVLLMVWPVARRLGIAFAAFILVNAIPPLLAGGVLSMGRLTATLFPVFLALAVTVRPRVIPPLITAFAIGQGLAAVLFFTWRPLF
jgi:hypothetical protein